VIAPLLFSLLFMAAGGLVCWFAWTSARDERRRIARSSLADGVVVAVRDESDEDVTYKVPIVRYAPAGRSELQFESKIRRHPPPYKVGDRVKVFYNPHAADKEADIVRGPLRYVALALGFGLPFIAIGAAVFFAYVVPG
jgi:hypothetical protein